HACEEPHKEYEHDCDEEESKPKRKHHRGRRHHKHQNHQNHQDHQNHQNHQNHDEYRENDVVYTTHIYTEASSVVNIPGGTVWATSSCY
ncbi:hypothetical protein GGH15_003026, partial [Coemansia sp. RSA 562]